MRPTSAEEGHRLNAPSPPPQDPILLLPSAYPPGTWRMNPLAPRLQQKAPQRQETGGSRQDWEPSSFFPRPVAGGGQQRPTPQLPVKTRVLRRTKARHLGPKSEVSTPENRRPNISSLNAKALGVSYASPTLTMNYASRSGDSLAWKGQEA